MPRRTARTVVLTAALLLVAACSGQQRPDSYADQLSSRISTDAVMRHLEQFQLIADNHGGNRQTGTPGYEASVGYVSGLLQEAGFDVVIDEFEAGMFTVDAEALSVNDITFAARAVEYSAASPIGGAHGPVVVAPEDSSAGCSVTDYAGMPVRGAVVIARRGGCYLSDKASAATELGAVALVVVNDVDEKVFSAGLLAEDGVQIPVLSVSRADGIELVRQRGTATAEVAAQVEQRQVRSVIAQTATGSTDDVVMVGAHLDSVRHGPGINDNASGAAAVLETALQMGSDPAVENAVRFAFWGGEEEWLLGSQHYVGSLDEAALAKIALYLNFDMVASPNPGYLVLDSDGTMPPDPDAGVTAPAGSAAIEQAIVDHLSSRGVPAGDLLFDGRGDWNPFALTGIPVGALCTGNEGNKTVEQARMWGGTAGQAFDPNYHAAGDTIDNVSRDALDITGPAIAHVVGRYAEEQSGRYGVANQQDRIRQVLQP